MKSRLGDIRNLYYVAISRKIPFLCTNSALNIGFNVENYRGSIFCSLRRKIADIP
ncbi:hypothetical protein IBX35_06285 [Candidatus Bathyarchaeota archaeon]|nr:hypothetical protein [Candidatus Bathyarchaeota archaeon]